MFSTAYVIVIIVITNREEEMFAMKDNRLTVVIQEGDLIITNKGETYSVALFNNTDDLQYHELAAILPNEEYKRSIISLEKLVKEGCSLFRANRRHYRWTEIEIDTRTIDSMILLNGKTLTCESVTLSSEDRTSFICCDEEGNNFEVSTDDIVKFN